MPSRRPPVASRLVTGPLAFFVAGVVDVSAAWARWGAGALTARLARRLAR
jgi:hypothetical protein